MGKPRPLDYQKIKTSSSVKHIKPNQRLFGYNEGTETSFSILPKDSQNDPNIGQNREIEDIALDINQEKES